MREKRLRERWRVVLVLQDEGVRHWAEGWMSGRRMELRSAHLPVVENYQVICGTGIIWHQDNHIT